MPPRDPGFVQLHRRFVRVEDLADEGFQAALDPEDSGAFHSWRGGGMIEAAWFFLDSVDETRLNRKSPEKAVRRFAKRVGRVSPSGRNPADIATPIQPVLVGDRLLDALGEVFSCP